MTNEPITNTPIANNPNRLLQTKRLTLRPLTVDDAASLFDAFRDVETMRFMDQPPHSEVEQTRDHLTQMITPGSCWWAITHHDNEQAVGFIGYMANTPIPGMGYLLRREDWRQGYMTEAITAALAYGFTTLNLDRIELWINDANIASQRLAETAGFTRRGQFRMKYPHDDVAHDKLVYGLYRYEWQARPERTIVRPRACYGLQPILAVADIQATVAFYCQQLDFSLEFLFGDPPDYGAVGWHDWSGDGAVIQLDQQPHLPPGRKDVGLFLFVGPEIDSLYTTYQNRGVTIVREIATQPWGLREFALEDCNGYVLRFGTPV